mgnify:CR=1 FL=1
MRFFLAAALALAPLPAFAQAEVMAPILAEAGPGTRWGVVVADSEGREVVALNPEGRFMPASNTKIFITAAALWAEAQGVGPDLANSGAQVRLETAGRRNTPDVILTGRGDARLSAAPTCVSDCLSALADAVAGRSKAVHDVVGDATVFPDQRWSPGMSWNNIPSPYGTGISALTLDDNEINAVVTPGVLGSPPQIALPAYYSIDNHARTVPGDSGTLAYDRLPFSRVLVVTGTIGAAHAPLAWRLGVDDPAEYAAWRLAEMLRARGVAVSGKIVSRYRPSMPEDDPKQRTGMPVRPPFRDALATLTPGPLSEDIATINKVSQNLHSELLLRRLGLARGTGSIADGQAVVQAMLTAAGVAGPQVSLSDGSGMSTYNRVAPRGMVRLLGWIAKQPWGGQFRASLPIGGVDGTLRRRFAGTPLASKVFAKTGSLNATNALAGWLTAASGKTLTFAIYANDVPEGVSATAIIDRALVALAAAN